MKFVNASSFIKSFLYVFCNCFNREKGNLAKILEKSEKLSKDEIFELDNKSTNQVATRYNWPYIIERYEKLFLED